MLTLFYKDFRSNSGKVYLDWMSWDGLKRERERERGLGMGSIDG